MPIFRTSSYCLTVMAIALTLPACGNNPAVTTLPSPTGSPSPTTSPNSVTTVPSVTPPISSPQLEKSATSRAIETRLTPLFASATGISLESINCPSSIDLKVGSQFECETVADGQTFAIAVELTDATGSQFNWTTRGVLQLTKLEQFIQEQVKAKGGKPVTVDCGSKIRAAKVGESFSCQVTATAGTSRVAKVTVKDDRGDVNVTL